MFRRVVASVGLSLSLACSTTACGRLGYDDIDFARRRGGTTGSGGSAEGDNAITSVATSTSVGAGGNGGASSPATGGTSTTGGAGTGGTTTGDASTSGTGGSSGNDAGAGAC